MINTIWVPQLEEKAMIIIINMIGDLNVTRQIYELTTTPLENKTFLEDLGSLTKTISLMARYYYCLFEQCSQCWKWSHSRSNKTYGLVTIYVIEGPWRKCKSSDNEQIVLCLYYGGFIHIAKIVLTDQDDLLKEVLMIKLIIIIQLHNCRHGSRWHVKGSAYDKVDHNYPIT